MSDRYDIVVVGGGVVGLSVAREATRQFPRMRVVVLEQDTKGGPHGAPRGGGGLLKKKKKRWSPQKGGHHSGVIHSGVYYKPGSMKARTCVEGAAAMVEFCREHGVPFEVCGKVIVATSQDEVPRLQNLLERGQANGVPGLRLL